MVLVKGISVNETTIWRRAQATSRFGSHVLLTAATNVLLALLGFATGVLAARLLGPQGRGELAAIQLWPSFIGTIAMLGLPEALVYFAAREPAGAGRYLGSAVTLALVSAIPFMVAGYLLMPVLLSAQPTAVVEAARWYLLLVPLYALVGTPYHPLRGMQDFVGWNVLRVLPGLGWLLVLVLAWMIGRAEPRWVAGVYLLTLALLFFPVVAVVGRRIPGPYWPVPRDWGPLIRFGVPSAASGLPQMLNYRLDQMMMAAFLPSPTLGLYVVAVAWGNMAVPLLGAIGSVAFPRVASQPDGPERAWAFAQASRMAVLVGLTVGPLLLAATPWGLPWIFGARFGEAVPAALTLVVAGTIWGLNQVLEEGLRGLGRPTVPLWAEFAGLLVTALSLWLLLPRLGLIGAAVASLAGYATSGVVATGWAARIAKVSGRKLFIPGCAEFRSLMNYAKHFWHLAGEINDGKPA